MRLEKVGRPRSFYIPEIFSPRCSLRVKRRINSKVAQREEHAEWGSVIYPNSFLLTSGESKMGVIDGGSLHSSACLFPDGY